MVQKVRVMRGVVWTENDELMPEETKDNGKLVNMIFEGDKRR